jgi:hypoxanthine phosphoribosyltransferase
MTRDLERLLTPKDIGSVVGRLAEVIREDYRDKNPVLISVLKGAFVFTADLARTLDIDLEVDFIQPSSYRDGKEPSGDVALIKRLESDVSGRHVIIVEGIVDRGLTLKKVMEEIGRQGPASLRVCSLLVREGLGADVRVDYAGISVAQGFVVGYGMDLDGRYRNLGGIYRLKEKG